MKLFIVKKYQKCVQYQGDGWDKRGWFRRGNSMGNQGRYFGKISREKILDES